MNAATDILSNTASLKAFAPELILSAGILWVLVWDLLRGGRAGRLQAGFWMVVTVLAAGVAIAMTGGHYAGRGLFGGLIARDPYADFFKYLFLAVTLIVGIQALHSKDTIDYTAGDRNASEFFALTLTLCLGMFLMAGAADLLMAFLSLELVSIMGYVLAGFKPNDRASSEAALKYVIYGGVSSGVMLYGMSLLYGLTGHTDFAAIAHATQTLSEPFSLIVAAVLVLGGFGFKIAAVPFHMWCPDVYEGSPTPVTTMLSVGPKAAGFALLLRFLLLCLPPEIVPAGSVTPVAPWVLLLAVLAVATMTLGNLAAIVQNNLKRLLAYSSIAHAGYLLLGCCALSEEGGRAVMFYLVVYLFMNAGAFIVVNALEDAGQGVTVDDYKGLGKRAPLLAGVLAVFLLSLTGLPPLAGFAGKFLLFYALLAKGGSLLVTIAVIGVLNSAVSLYYYARVLKAMYLDAPARTEPVAASSLHTGMAVVMAVPTVVIGLYWQPLRDACERFFQTWPGAAGAAHQAVAIVRATLR